MLVTVLFIVTMMPTGHLMYDLLKHNKERFPRAIVKRDCSSSILCQPGFRLLGCRCSPCKPGFFTSEMNREDECHRCYQSCKPALNMEVVKECTRTSDVECRCRDGFNCTERDPYTHHCERCDPITKPTPSLPFISPYSYPASILSTDSQQIDRMDGNSLLIWIFIGFSLIILSIMVLTIFCRFCKKKEKECFKQFVRQCSLGNLEMDSETTPPNSQPSDQREMPSHDSTPTNQQTGCPFHQPTVSPQAVSPSGNLGPLHIYGPQTVFVSLLNQFGYDGGDKKANELQEESISSINVPHPQSPPINLSQEEKSYENDFIFFPSQEQGKECHISKEEGL
nr:tumor necrosis factor receptor superfamily member 16 isoform X2 [Misgurnus anguillicaudatus]